MINFTPETLNEEIKRWRSPPSAAREHLKQVRNAIDELITCVSDVDRIRLYYQLNQLIDGYASLGDLLVLSKIANSSENYWES